MQQGWLPDPSGRPHTLRYFDGTAWTGHVTTTASAPPQRDGWRVATWVLAGFLALSAALNGLLGLVVLSTPTSPPVKPAAPKVPVGPATLACPGSSVSDTVQGDGYVRVPIGTNWVATSEASYGPYWMECGGLAQYQGGAGYGYLAVGRLAPGYPGGLAQIAEDVLAEELESGGLSRPGATEATATTVDGRPVWRVDAVGYESAGAEQAAWGDTVRILVIEHEGTRPSVIAVQVSGSDSEARTRIDVALQDVRIP